jgi:diguanylate cyclase (GGDEF)-like protein/PAS domain S-box-containing protein
VQLSSANPRLTVSDVSTVPRPAELQSGSERRERLLLKALPIGMLVTDRSGRCLDANPAALSLLELPYESVVGTAVSKHLAGVAELMMDANPANANSVDAGELRVRRHNGSELIIEVSASSLDCSRDPAIVYFFREISDEIALAEQLRETALTDPLTRLPNRCALEQQVDLALRNISRDGPEGVLCFLDLDNFKAVNDTCGHAAGDALLRMVADTLRQRTRATDAIGRIGGDEFALLLNGCHPEDAIDCVSALRRKILNLGFAWDGAAFQIGLSAGLTLLTRSTASVADALAEADMACFAAKSAGRGETRVFTERLRAAGRALSADAATVHELKQALAADAISLSAQPLTALQGYTGMGPMREILLRMTGRGGQLIPPSALLPLASRFGLAQQVDRWILRRLLNWLDRGHAPQRQGRFYVNITASSLVDESFVAFLQDALADRDSSLLGIEIQERDIMLHYEAAARTIRALDARGCRVAIDRISGRAEAIDAIADLPVSLLKLGPEFSAIATVGDITYVHTEAMIRIAHKLSLPVTATGIETEYALLCVRDLGAEFAQGVAVAPPALLIPAS